MTKDTNLSRIKFINSDDGTEISATNIKVFLPNNFGFVIKSEPEEKAQWYSLCLGKVQKIRQSASLQSNLAVEIYSL